MAEALVRAEQALERLGREVVREGRDLVDDADKGAPDLLHEGMRAGLILQRDTVRMAQAELEEARAAKAPPDYKLLRLGNEAAAALGRLAMRAAEGEFQRRKTGSVERLLAEIAEERRLSTPAHGNYPSSRPVT